MVLGKFGLPEYWLFLDYFHCILKW